MKIVEKIQFESFNENSYVIAQDIENMLKDEALKSVNVVVGIFKDEAFDVLKESFETAKNNNVEINFVVGIDRKSISKQVLEQMKDISKSVYIYNNNANDNFNAKLYVFKYENYVEVLVPTTNFTLKGITTDYANVTKIRFDIPNDEKEYNDFMYGIKEYIYPNLGIFTLLDEKVLEELELKRELMQQKGKDGTLPTIEDYLKKSADMHRSLTDEEVEQKIKSKLDDIVKEFDIQIDN